MRTIPPVCVSTNVPIECGKGSFTTTDIFQTWRTRIAAHSGKGRDHKTKWIISTSGSRMAIVRISKTFFVAVQVARLDIVAIELSFYRFFF